MAEERARLQASVRQRLLNIAQREGIDFQLVLTRYGLERFLYRLGRSPHRSTFLLKGAFLFYAWQQEVDRPTRDLDLLGHGTPDILRLENIVADMATVEVDDDGLDFLPDTIKGEAIREASLYDGIRLKLVATLGRTRIPVQIDIGFGDAAEKLKAMVALGDINTRLKDYYDLLRLSRTMALPREGMIEALRATFMRRGTVLPDEVPPGLADSFADDSRTRMWDAFITRNGLDTEGASFADVVRELRSSYWPLILAVDHVE